MIGSPPKVDGRALMEVFRRYLRDHNLPILVFNMENEAAFEAALRGEQIGTLIAAGEAEVAS